MRHRIGRICASSFRASPIRSYATAYRLRAICMLGTGSFDFMARNLATLWNCGMISVAVANVLSPDLPRFMICFAMGALIAHSIHSIKQWWAD